MSLPVVECLEHSATLGEVLYILVGDEAFPFQSWLLRPYLGQGIPEEQRIFNYKLSRARWVIENAFGILAPSWRVFRQPIQSIVEKTDWIVKATICLHNFLWQTNSAGDGFCWFLWQNRVNQMGRMEKFSWW